MGYSCLMAYGSAATAYEYAKRWLSLVPDDPAAQKLVWDCEKYLEEENSLELDWKEREEIIRWETIPPADDDILGHVKVHIDQYFGVYTQNSSRTTAIRIILWRSPSSCRRPEHDDYTCLMPASAGIGWIFRRSVGSRKNWDGQSCSLQPAPRLEATKADCREERWSWPIQMMLATAHFAMEDPEVGL